MLVTLTSAVVRRLLTPFKPISQPVGQGRRRCKESRSTFFFKDENVFATISVINDKFFAFTKQKAEATRTHKCPSNLAAANKFLTNWQERKL
jgi:hypothetical protein